MMIDWDKCKIPDGCSIDEPEALAEKVIDQLLPAEFHDVTCYCQYSASAGAMPGVFSAHFWFWLDRKVGNQPLKDWLEINAPAVDRSLYNAIQAHYVADPIITGAPDPIKQRSWWISGARDEVTLPDLNAIELKQVVGQRKRDALAGKGLTGSQVSTVEGALALIGDGAGLEGFHAPLMRAAWVYALRTQPSDRDPEALKVIFREATWRAPKGPGRASDIHRYTGDDWLDNQIQGAFDKVTVARSGLQECEPHLDLPTKTVEEVREWMAAQFDAYFAAPWEQPSEFLKNVNPDARPLPMRVLLVAEVGLGKTQDILERVETYIEREKAAGRPWRVIYAVPMHKLGKEIDQRCAGLKIKSATWRGRNYVEVAGDVENPMCLDIEAVDLAGKAGALVETAVCRRFKGRGKDKKLEYVCKFHHECRYQSQKAAVAAADLIVCSHQILFSGLPEEMKSDIAMVVLDESFWQSGINITGLHESTFSVAELRKNPVLRTEVTKGADGKIISGRQVPNRIATKHLAAYRSELMSAFSSARADGCLYLRLSDINTDLMTAEDARTAAGLKWNRKIEPSMRPGMDFKARQDEAERCMSNSTLGRLAATWRCVAELISTGNEATGRIEFMTVPTRNGPIDEIRLNLIDEFPEAVTACPTLMADATGYIDVVQHFLPDTRLVKSETPILPPQVHIHQIVGPVSKTSIEGKGICARFRDFILATTQGEPSLLITHKEFEQHFQNIPHLAIAHFNDIAGRDEWKHVRYCIVLGQPRPSPASARQIAAALTGKPIALENPVTAEVPAVLNSGIAVEIKCSRFKDPELEMVASAIGGHRLFSRQDGRGR